jgi:CRISPR-associated endonuclease/helicase Cas3
LSACIDDNNDNNDYLSHPIEKEKHSLLEHSLAVALKAQELLSTTKFPSSEIGFYSGLLHDIGKLNPYYQILFKTERSQREKKQEELRSIYEPFHSPFSAWIAEKLLEKKQEPMDYALLDKIILLIYGHHSKLHKSIGQINESESLKITQKEIFKHLEKFSYLSSRHVSGKFSKLSWNNCLSRFLDPIRFDVELASNSNANDAIKDFLELSVAYSCLLQADRGSFAEWFPSHFNLKIDTSSLIKEGSKLSYIRNILQSEIKNNFEYDKPISIINAPTGVGKTKVFLDLIANYQSRIKNLERIFYFSPLLALTEDFEKKFAYTLYNKSIEEVLIYNHLFSGSLEEKKMMKMLQSVQTFDFPWIFNNESFNRQFVISTTQRFLITVFSNKQADKLKLASFRNSLIILDEVQTIPKYILGILISILQKMNQFLGTRTILVSATIPHELNSIHATTTTKIEKGSLRSYLDLTKKRISFVKWSEDLAIKKGRTLIMANTRRKASSIFQAFSEKDKFPDAIYLSSGIKKKDRINILEDIHEKERLKEQFILVSTQVVEAGVDISFSQIFREKAPIDSIIQVMGRLNREAENDDARLVIYDYDDEYRPYSQLELRESEMILRTVKNSVELYSKLGQYYASISEKNNLYKNYAEELQEYIMKLDFDNIWDFINKHVLSEDKQDSVLIPEIEEWEETKKALMKKKLTRHDYRKFSVITASLPPSFGVLENKDYFDNDLFEQNILLPKKECLNEVYDRRMGTDKLIHQ